MQIDIWSDVVCPWCYIGKRRFETALSGFAHREDVMVTWRSFELDPTSPPSTEAKGTQAEKLAAKMGRSVPQAQQMLDQVTALAATVGLDFRFDLARNGNTFDAHRLLHLAKAHGLQDRLKERFDRGTFTEGLSVSDHDELTRLAVEVGLDEAEVRETLASAAYADEVRGDVAQAAAYGIRGVPFFVVDGKYGISGAQEPEQIRAVLDQAWSERPQLVVTQGGGADACEGDNCAV